LIIVTTIVCGPNSSRSSGSTSFTWWAFSVSSTASCGPASAMRCTALAVGACSSLPSSRISLKPLARIASRFLLRAMKVTSSPARASLAPR
jgi:hypothetical protein